MQICLLPVRISTAGSHAPACAGVQPGVNSFSGAPCGHPLWPVTMWPQPYSAVWRKRSWHLFFTAQVTTPCTHLSVHGSSCLGTGLCKGQEACPVSQLTSAACPRLAFSEPARGTVSLYAGVIICQSVVKVSLSCV